MADESTYGFSRADALELVQLIGNRDREFPEIRPRGGGKSSSLQIIRFTLVEDYYDADGGVPLDCESRDPNDGPPFYGIVAEKGCGMGSVYGMDEEGVVELDDPLQILVGRDYRELPGKTGIAVLLRNDSVDEYAADDYLPRCVWVIVYIDFHREIQVVTDVVVAGTSIVIERKNVWVWDDCLIPSEVIEGDECVEEYYNGGGV